MEIAFRSQFSENPDLVIVFTNSLNGNAEQPTLTHRAQKFKPEHSQISKKSSAHGAPYRHFYVYSRDTFFYNEIIGFVKNGFFNPKEHETFKLYEQGKFREILYVPLPVYSEESEGVIPKTTTKNTKKVASNLNSNEKVSKLTPTEFIDKIRHLGAELIHKVTRKCKLEFDLSSLSNVVTQFNIHEGEFIEALVEGLSLGSYRFSYQEKKQPELAHSIAFVGSSVAKGELEQNLKRGVYIAEAIKLARNLENAAPNHLNISNFVKQSTKIAKDNKLKFNELGYQKLVKDGFGGIIAVNSASPEKAKLLVLEYVPVKATRTILLVGKGVLFDSGGLSLKPSGSMAEMKMDMSGAAVVLSVMSVVRKLGLGIRVLAAMPITDNLVGPHSFRVGDVIKLYNGKQVEVLNTDAEGRLILADALSYAIEKYRPDYTIDIATLTGACMVALGQHYAGLWSNDQDLSEALIHAGEETSELLWKMPLHREYLNDLKSPIADLKNIGGPYGGANTAAKFLEQFVADHKWAHLDIAGTMSYQQDVGYKKKGASGFGVRLILRFLQNQA